MFYVFRADVGRGADLRGPNAIRHLPGVSCTPTAVGPDLSARRARGAYALRQRGGAALAPPRMGLSAATHQPFSGPPLARQHAAHHLRLAAATRVLVDHYGSRLRRLAATAWERGGFRWGAQQQRRRWPPRPRALHSTWRCCKNNAVLDRGRPRRRSAAGADAEPNFEVPLRSVLRRVCPAG